MHRSTLYHRVQVCMPTCPPAGYHVSIRRRVDALRSVPQPTESCPPRELNFANTPVTPVTRGVRRSSRNVAGVVLNQLERDSLPAIPQTVQVNSATAR